MPDDNSTSGVSAAQIRAQCDWILASEGISRCGRQSTFFEYIVNATLEGHAGRLKKNLGY